MLTVHTRRSLFFTCVCVRSFHFFTILCVCLCSSFIDYLNVTTKLDISTSSNKLGFVFFLMCVFPFILNISLLFFKRLKLRIFFRVSIARFFFLLLLLFYFFFWHKIIFCNFHCFFGIKALHYFFAGCYNFNSFLFSLAFSHNYAKHARALSLIDLHCFECVCLCVLGCMCVSESVKQWLTSLCMCVYLFTWFIISFRS